MRQFMKNMVPVTFVLVIAVILYYGTSWYKSKGEVRVVSGTVESCIVNNWNVNMVGHYAVPISKTTMTITTIDGVVTAHVLGNVNAEVGDTATVTFTLYKDGDTYMGYDNCTVAVKGVTHNTYLEATRFLNP